MGRRRTLIDTIIPPQTGVRLDCYVRATNGLPGACRASRGTGPWAEVHPYATSHFVLPRCGLHCAALAIAGQF